MGPSDDEVGAHHSQRRPVCCGQVSHLPEGQVAFSKESIGARMFVRVIGVSSVAMPPYGVDAS